MAREGNDLEAVLTEDADADIDDDLAELRREQQRTNQECQQKIIESLEEFLQAHPGANFTTWIAHLHPENVAVDPRLRIDNNFYLVAWYEAGASAKAQEIRWLHFGITLLALIWMGLVVQMQSSAELVLHDGFGMLFMAEGLSIGLFIVQVMVWLTSYKWFHKIAGMLSRRTPSDQDQEVTFESSFKSWPRHIYKVSVGQVLAQTCVGIIGLTAFIYHEHGIQLVDCLRERHCTTQFKGKGIGSDVWQWRESRLVNGPFSSVSISVKAETPEGEVLPRTHVSNNGSLWDAVRVQAAVPLEVSIPVADTYLLVATLVIYILALVTTVLYIIVYRIAGQHHGRWVPHWLSLRRMHLLLMMLSLLLIAVSFVAGVHYSQGLFLAPVFIGHATFFALLSQLWVTSKRNLEGPFNPWQKRTMTAQGVAAMVAFTYTAGLCDSFSLCSVSRIWPSSHDKNPGLFVLATLFHMLLSTGYGWSLWIHLQLIRRRSPGAIPSRGEAAEDATDARELRAEAPPAEPQIVVSEQADAEDGDCIVCRDAPRNTVLVPCGHLVVCNPCAREIMRFREPCCPVCKATVIDKSEASQDMLSALQHTAARHAAAEAAFAAAAAAAADAAPH